MGSNNWRGSLFETEGLRSEEREIQDPTLDKDSYMGNGILSSTKLYCSNVNLNKHYFQGSVSSDVSVKGV